MFTFIRKNFTLLIFKELKEETNSDAYFFFSVAAIYLIKGIFDYESFKRKSYRTSENFKQSFELMKYLIALPLTVEFYKLLCFNSINRNNKRRWKCINWNFKILRAYSRQFRMDQSPSFQPRD
ncbi:hypothetical protein BpHYR1_039780 [Brachionus plicatilis]|uniref:Uncharacterized protein n=1 Tax=Brachionus plicatilis TaxID=10195 RepID=A0A3M7Q7A2_BRAPC|nr:hypothetical protein BpHYR1_039780 [Brachionus plicatilis]